jgi:predicted cytidylate kinase
MRISIAGDIGSGKTTIAAELARQIGAQLCSTGGIQRQLAAARRITTLELNRLAENDASIDEQIDGYLKALSGGDLVVESRMAWRFVPDTRKIFLYVLKQEAATRILRANRSDESYGMVDDAMAQISERRKSELKRFCKYYGVNIDDLRNYDRVIDTTFAPPSSVVARILTPDSLQARPGIWLSPKNLVPTSSPRPAEDDGVGQLAKSFARSGFDETHPVEVLYVNHAFFIVDGHRRAEASLRAGLEFVPAALRACEDEICVDGVTARRFVEDSVTPDMIRAWEAANNFQYPHPIWKIPARAEARRGIAQS